MESRTTAAAAAAEDYGALASPIKPETRVLRSHAKPPSDHRIATPQKTPEPPRFARGPGVVYSLRQSKGGKIGLPTDGEGAPDVGKGTKAKEEVEAAVTTDEQAPSGLGLVDLGKKPAKVAAGAPVKIPEKYEMLAQFFKSLESSYRLLRLKKRLCTLSNIAPKIECLTDKRFTYRHLAQLKHLVPEAISVKKTLAVDEATSWLKPDLQITLHSDAFGDSFEGKELSGYLVLTKVFQSRLLDFCKEHAEDEDIPEDELPEPFNCKKPAPSFDVDQESHPTSGPSAPVATDELENQKQPAASSHLSQSFQRRFSQKGRLTGKLPSADELVTTEIEATNLTLLSPTKCTRKPFLLSNIIPVSVLPSVKPTISCEETPKKSTDSFPLKSMDETPARALSTPARLMCPTPELKTPKRSRSHVDDDPRPSKKPVKRPLTMTPEKRTATERCDTSDADSDLDDAALHFLPKALLQSVREREKNVLEDQQAGVSERRKRQQMIACLPKLFDMVLLVFQSIGRSIITKEELVNKIIAGHCDIADRSEVEEQLSLLQQLLPDWITGKMACSGDYIFCIDKISNPEMLRQRLAEAK